MRRLELEHRTRPRECALLEGKRCEYSDVRMSEMDE